MVREISTSLVSQAQRLIEDLREMKMRANDLRNNSKVCKMFAGIQKQLSYFVEMISQYETNTSKQLSTIIPQIHGGGAEKTLLADMFEKQHASPFSHQALLSWIQGKEREERMLQAYLTGLKCDHIHFAFSPGELDSIVLSMDVDHVLCFALKIARNGDPFLEMMHKFLHTGKASQEDTKATFNHWYQDRKVASDIKNKAKIFKIFSAENSGSVCKFVATDISEDKDINFDAVEGADILLYSNGIPKSYMPSGPPEKLTAKAVTHDSVELEWSKPKHGAEGIKTYYVLYQRESDNQWTECASNDNSMTHTINDMLPGTTYFLKVQAQCEIGVSTPSDTITAKLPLGPPEKLTAAKKTHESIQLEWHEPKHGTDIIEGYKILYRREGDVPDQWTKVCSNDRATACTLNNLQPATTYHLKVVAQCEICTSTPSDTITIKLPLGPPEKLTAMTVAQESIQLEWQQPTHGADSIESYKVLYQKEGDAPDQWSEHCSSGKSTTCTINNLQPETMYHFKVQAQSEIGVSTPSDTLEKQTKIHLARHFKHCSVHIETNSNIIIYQLPSVVTVRNEDKNIIKCCIGNPKELLPEHKEKVLMLIGATGSGKSTLINGMANYIFGVRWEDDFRFKLISKETGQSRAFSQTECITVYSFPKFEDSPLPYRLTVIDTPGFGDTRGLERDDEITTHIKAFFSMKGDQGIDHIDGIGFVAQSPLARLTHTQKYIIDSILSVFGKDIADNIFIMTTFADSAHPPAVDAIKSHIDTFIPCVPSNALKFFKFNNSALFAKANEEVVQGFHEMYWKVGYTSFEDFFNHLDEAETKTLQLTRAVLDEREKLQILIQGVRQDIRRVMNDIDSMRQEKQAQEESVASYFLEHRMLQQTISYSEDEEIKITKHHAQVIIKNKVRATLEKVCRDISTARKCIEKLEIIALNPNPLSDIEYIEPLISAEKKEAKSGWEQRVKCLEKVRKGIIMKKSLEAMMDDVLKDVSIET